MRCKSCGSLILHLPNRCLNQNCILFDIPIISNETTIKNLSIFQEAENLINGDRRKDYGPAKESLEAAAHAFTGVLYHKLKSPISAKEVALCMAAYKCVRESGGSGKRDNLVDICGYAGLAEMINEKKG